MAHVQPHSVDESSGLIDWRPHAAAWMPSAGEMLWVRVRDESTRSWVTPVGELDLGSAAFFDHEMRHTQSRRRWVVLDLRALAFIDCIGLRSVVAARRRATESDDRLDVLCGSGQVARILSISGFARLVEVIEARPEPDQP